jgi:Tfp pilus assembly major pilin PilA
LPANNSAAGLALSGEIVGKYVSEVNVATGVIAVRYGLSAHQVISAQHLTLTPDTSNPGSVGWVCATAGTEIENKHLPAACRT